MIERFGRVLRYLAVPLKTAPLLLIIVFSVLMTLAIKATLFGIVLGMLLLSGFFKYSYVLLDQLADGKTDPPVLSIEMMNPIDEHRSLMILVLVVAVFFGTDAAVYWFGPVFSVLVGVLTLVAQLAVITVQGATGSLAQSLNPVRCVRLVLRLRGDYALIVACALAMWLMAGLASVFGAPLTLRLALFMYAWLAIFSLIGGVIHERRLEIGLDDAHVPDAVELDEREHVERARQQNLDRIYAEWRGGSHKNAWQTVMTYLAQSAEPLTELRWLYERAARWPDQRFANRLAQELLPQLLALRCNGEALDTVRRRLAASPEFRPIASADLIRLAQLARDAGDRRSARELLRDFDRLYPDDPARASVALLSQQLER